jgi:hypothetical protein
MSMNRAAPPSFVLDQRAHLNSTANALQLLEKPRSWAK